jgi:hypothetical protein
VALKLDLTLIKLGPSLSSPGPASPEIPSRLGAIARPSTRLWPESESSSEVDNSSCSQSIVSLGSCPSTAPTLSDLPLTPIPELLRTPTKHNRPFIADATTMPEPPAMAYPNEKQRRNLVSRLPAPLDHGPIVAQLVQGENDVGAIQTVRLQ